MRFSRVSRLAAAAVGVAALALASAGGAIAGRCTSISGTFTSSVYYPPECLSEIGVCQHETWSGSHVETGEFVFHTLLNAGDPLDPTRYDYTGSHVWSTHGGALLFGEDTGVLHIDPYPPMPFEATSVITGGTRQYRGATGEIHLTSILDGTTGLSEGTYDGTVCT